MVKKKPPPGIPGRPPHKPTDANRRTVEWARMLNRNQAEIARVLGISEKTLRDHYAFELDVANIRTGVMLMQTATMKALGIATPGGAQDIEKVSERSLLWLLERKFGMAPPVQRTRLSGSLGTYGPDDLAALSDEDLEALDRLHDKIEVTSAHRDPRGDGAEDEGSAGA